MRESHDIRALTLTQPLAHLAAVGAKRLDARGWRTPYRGPVAIYAARWRAGMSWRELRALCLSEPYRSILYGRPLPALGPRFASDAGHAAVGQQRLIGSCRDLPRGVIVAVGELIECRRLEDGEDVPGGVEAELGTYTPLCAVWELADVRPLALPVRVARGIARSGLWRLPLPLRELVEIAATLPLPGAPEPMISRQGREESPAPAHPETTNHPTNPEMKTQLKKAPARKAAKVAETGIEPILQTVSAEPNPVSSQPARFEAGLPLAQIRPSPVNPRKAFAGPAMDELVASVRASGVTNPILVRPIRDLLNGVEGDQVRFEIVAGERRFRASALAGRDTIPAMVEDMDDVKAGEKQAIENLNRADLSPLEEGAGYKHLLSLPGYTMARLMETTGKSEASVYARLKLLEAPAEVIEALEQNLIPATTAELITRCKGDVRTRAAAAILRPDPHRYRHGESGPLSFRDSKAEIVRLEEEEKERQAALKRRQEAEARGLRWLDAAELKKVCGYGYDASAESGLTTLDQTAPGSPELDSWRILFAGPGKAAEGTVAPVAAGEWSKRVIEFYEREKLRAALLKVGVKLTNRAAPANASEAKRRAREKRMKAIVDTAAAVIREQTADVLWVSARTPERTAWLALARASAQGMGHDGSQTFCRRRALEIVHVPGYGGEGTRPDVYATVAAFLDDPARSARELAGFVAEVLLTRGAWWNHAEGFSKTFVATVPAFGVDLSALCEQHGEPVASATLNAQEGTTDVCGAVGEIEADDLDGAGEEGAEAGHVAVNTR